MAMIQAMFMDVRAQCWLHALPWCPSGADCTAHLPVLPMKLAPPHACMTHTPTLFLHYTCSFGILAWQLFSGRKPWVKDPQDGCLRHNPHFMSSRPDSEAVTALPQFRQLVLQ